MWKKFKYIYVNYIFISLIIYGSTDLRVQILTILKMRNLSIWLVDELNLCASIGQFLSETWIRTLMVIYQLKYTKKMGLRRYEPTKNNLSNVKISGREQDVRKVGSDRYQIGRLAKQLDFDRIVLSIRLNFNSSW